MTDHFTIYHRRTTGRVRRVVRAAGEITLFVDPALDLLCRRIATCGARPKVLALNAPNAIVVRWGVAGAWRWVAPEPERRQISCPSFGRGCEIVVPRERRNFNESSLLVVDTQDGVLEIRTRLCVGDL